MAALEIQLSDEDVERLAVLIADRLQSTVVPTNSQPKLLWSEPQTAGILGISNAFLKKMRQEGFIVAHTNRRPILYAWEHIEAAKRWLSERESVQ